MQVVTEQDLEPPGMICAHCDQPFHLGDNAYGIIEAVTADGIVVEMLVCVTCWAAG